jgi:hypothetical protein
MLYCAIACVNLKCLHVPHLNNWWSLRKSEIIFILNTTVNSNTTFRFNLLKWCFYMLLFSKSFELAVVYRIRIFNSWIYLRNNFLFCWCIQQGIKWWSEHFKGKWYSLKCYLANGPCKHPWHCNQCWIILHCDMQKMRKSNPKGLRHKNNASDLYLYAVFD